MYDQNKIEIGNTVIAGGWINPLLQYRDQAKEPLLIDSNWKPPFFVHPDVRVNPIHLYRGDKLTVISNEIEPPEGCMYYLRHVKNEEGQQFYLSAIYFYKEPFEEK